MVSMPNGPLAPSPIDYVVVLMLENRSFDNVLGGLYGPHNLPPYQTAPTGQAGFDGIPPGASNPGPTGLPVYAHNQTAPTSVGTGPSYAPTTIPNLDPGEYFNDVAQQLMGLDALPKTNPWGGYSPTGPSGAQGYVKNYAALSGTEQKTPPAANQADVMNYFTPAQLPVSAFLARSYGLSDQWFASVPSQTYVNRTFALSAAPAVSDTSTPFSLVEDAQYFVPDPLKPGNPPLKSLRKTATILQQLDEAMSRAGATGPFWKVYFHDYSITYDTLEYVRAAVPTGATAVNFGSFDGSDWGSEPPTQFGGTPVGPSFADDVANGTLPPLSWIEPRYFDDWAPTGLPPNSNHPGSARKLFVSAGTQAPIDAATGEVLLMELYNLLRGSPLWDRTLLIVTYDESCGIWDHVPPPRAKPPGHGIPPASDDLDHAAKGFDFDVFGGRVPAIVVSPTVPVGTLFRGPTGSAPFDHTSIVTTVRDLFLVPLGATAPLTDRDAAAPSLAHALGPTGINQTGPFAGTIVAGPMSLYFTSDLSDGPPPQTVFANAGPGFTLLAAAHQAETDPGWLSCTGTTTITVTADPSQLEHHRGYTGYIEISSAGAVNSGIQVPVVYDVVW
jgi:phospholipase C